MSAAVGKRIKVVCAMAVSLVLATGTAAEAVPSPPSAPSSPSSAVPDGEGLTLDLGSPRPNSVASESAVTRKPKSTGPTTMAAALSFSPAGCTGYTDYPHKSNSDASVHGRTKCRVQVPYVEVTSLLRRDRWWGQQQVGSPRTSHRTNNPLSGDATPHYYCAGQGLYSYRGYSSHKSLENGRTYVASTSNWQLPGISQFWC